MNTLNTIIQSPLNFGKTHFSTKNEIYGFVVTYSNIIGDNGREHTCDDFSYLLQGICIKMK